MQKRRPNTLALGAFSLTAKTLEARAGFMPKPVVDCGFALDYFVGPGGRGGGGGHPGVIPSRLSHVKTL